VLNTRGNRLSSRRGLDASKWIDPPEDAIFHPRV
jgi:hypothetical protein